MSKIKEETIKIIETPLLITSSEKIEGMLTLEKANKYKIGLFETINFKTYCALNDKLSNYYSNYVILIKTGKWLFPYKEPFTNQSIFETDSRIVRGLSNNIDLTYTGNETNLQVLTQSKLGQLFPNEKALEEYKSLLKSFAEENKKAFYETKTIYNDEEHQITRLTSEITPYSIPNQSRGKEIFEELTMHNEKSNEIYTRLCEPLDETTTQVLRYTIKK